MAEYSIGRPLRTRDPCMISLFLNPHKADRILLSVAKDYKIVNLLPKRKAARRDFKKN